MDVSAEEQPLERFKPTTGAFVGWTGMVFVGLTVVYVALQVHSLTGLRLALGAMFAGVLIWVTQLRPRVTAYPRDLVLVGLVTDTVVPYARIERVAMGQTFSVWADGRRHVCVGLGSAPTRDMRRSVRMRSQGGIFAVNRVHQLPGGTDEVTTDRAAMTYHDYVLTRINELVRQARKGRDDEAPAGRRVRRRYAVPEIAGLLVTGLVFAASLLLL